MDSCIDALSAVLEVGDHDTSLAVRACSGLQSAFFEQPADVGRKLLATVEMENESAINILFMFLSGILVFLMQAGFAMQCVGSVRVKNAKNILLKNIIDGCLAAVVFYFVGFGFTGFTASSDEPGNAFIGIDDFLLSKTGRTGLWHRFFFNWAFAAASTTIVSGSVAERCKFEAYAAYSVLITACLYPIAGHWLWASHGWLSAWTTKPLFGIGVIDFAGCLVVHYVGGLSGFIGAAVLGPRKGRFDENGKVVVTTRFDGHSAPLVCLGTFLLWVGWYGFNCGSALAIDSADSMEIVTRSFVTTTMAAGSAGITTVFWIKYRAGIYDMGALCNGILSGLVSITSAAACVSPWSAFLIGIPAAILFNLAQEFILHYCKVDDPLAASAMHGVVGLYGVLMPTLFAQEYYLLQSVGLSLENLPTPNTAKGLFFGGDGRMLGATIVGIIAVTAWAVFLMTPFFMFLKKMNLLRVPESDEDDGLDIVKHGGLAYNTVPSNLAQKLGNARISPAGIVEEA